ncbi:hypothetical protein RHMOL_Rhmol08G0204400 [Rhododendron molle]|uniref:Uncharacterized protein n=2 Tax=Rhododendron molle TaxID=49168 RepID=A0ACC0MS23_RHOML|nr:hypothetical protein RHMOL_Rhmol08G0204400 [Rhododendron molle]KAI8543282.1 hypothetical protein RHMOL_Rhmol08G0204400 [Rhododendron molle]
MRRESTERVAPTTTITGNAASTSTGDHASHLHNRYPTPSLLFSNPLSLSRVDSPGHRTRGALPTAGDRHHNRLLGSPTLPHHEVEEGGELYGQKVYLFGSSEHVRWWSSSRVKIWRSQWREPSVKSRGWEKKSSDHATVKDSSAAAKEIEVNQRPRKMINLL